MTAESSQFTEDTPEQTPSRTRSDAVAIGLSTLCHALIIFFGGLLVLGGGVAEERTVITTSISDTESTKPIEVPDIELLPDPEEELVGGLAGVEDATQTEQTLADFAVGNMATAAIRIETAGGAGGAFFGVGEGTAGQAGKRIVYIVDASGSMTYPLARMSRFHRVKQELETSVKSLSSSQRFCIILFNEDSRTVASKAMRTATDKTKRWVVDKIWDATAFGGTDPRSAIQKAIRFRPDTIYFLTDGMFPAQTARGLLKKRKGLTVHTFTLGDRSGEAVMKRIARVNGGNYRFVSGMPEEPQTVAGPVSGSGATSTK